MKYIDRELRATTRMSPPLPLDTKLFCMATAAGLLRGRERLLAMIV